MRTALLLLGILLAGWTSLPAESRYQKAPDDVRRILDAPATPALLLSPARTHALLAEPMLYPPIAEVSQPVLRLAGIRINPRTNGLQTASSYARLTLKRISDGVETPIVLPNGLKAGAAHWNKDGSAFAFTATAPDHIELWIGAAATGKAHRVENVRLNAVFGPGYQWLDDSRTILLHLIPAGRGGPPAEPVVPLGPHVQESSGRAGPVRTYEDMLSNPHDEDLFDYYATAQLAWLDTRTGKITNAAKPEVYTSAQPSPDGNHLLTTAVKRPYSYLHPYNDFPREVEVRDRAGNKERTVASLPLADRVPIDGVQPGPRNVAWQPGSGASLLWVEALDGGNPKEKALFRDRVVMLKAPFAGEPTQVTRLEQRFQSMMVADNGTVALMSDYERNKRWSRTFLIDLEHPDQAPELLFSRNIQDRYGPARNAAERTAWIPGAGIPRTHLVGNVFLV